ncbi:hypothetical protein K505DRAFT_256308, partial [Melanomma pulvis-pyrius CBS 109.77]
MAEKTPPPTLNGSHLNIRPPPPTSHASSNHSTSFTPRSSTFPDGLDSDSEFDAFDPTPVHSPGGPHYDDLPPSYDEAQQQALHEARHGVPPLDPNNLEVHRMVLSDGQSPPPPHPNAQPQRSVSSLLSNPNAYEFEPENRRNARGLGQTVPVQQVRNSEQIPVGQVNVPNENLPTNGTSTVPVHTSMLLDRALEFTRHAPDADAQYAPRLTRYVAIPQEGVTSSRNTKEPVQFLRSYAKALHTHSIRPAEFTEFLDGLNALCTATRTTSSDLVNADPSEETLSAVVREYIDRANEDFFAPRGLHVRIESLSWLTEALQIPEERGQRAAAVVSALDETSTVEQRALAIHPWIEKLEGDVPGPSTKTLVLREMGERFGRQRGSGVGGEDDPPHSLPDPQTGADDTGFRPFPFGGRGPGMPSVPGVPGLPGMPGVGGPWAGNQGPWGRGGHGHHGYGWGAMGSGPWGPPPHHRGNARGRAGPGFPFAPRGFGPSGPGNVNSNPNNTNWSAFGLNIGKWGEEFGRRMGEWGEQTGKMAQEWG